MGKKKEWKEKRSLGELLIKDKVRINLTGVVGLRNTTYAKTKETIDAPTNDKTDVVTYQPGHFDTHWIGQCRPPFLK